MVVETRSVKRRRLMNVGPKEVLDRISDLPDDILRSILHLLPIKSAAQSVVLSRRWRNLFSSLTDLDLTSVELPGNKDFIIKRVLSRRHKKSSIRTLKVQSRLASMTLKSLSRCAKTNNIQELEVSVYFIYPKANFPWDILIHCGSSLKVLRLNRLILNLSPTQSMNHGFKWLHTITLSNIITHSLHQFTNSMFPCLKKLILNSFNSRTGPNINCSGLEDLVINECHHLNSLDICGLKLARLIVVNCFSMNHNIHTKIKIVAPVIKYLKWEGIEIRHIPVLEISTTLDRAYIGIRRLHNNIITPAQRRGLFNMIIALSHVKILDGYMV